MPMILHSSIGIVRAIVMAVIAVACIDQNDPAWISSSPSRRAASSSPSDFFVVADTFFSFNRNNLLKTFQFEELHTTIG